MKKKLAKTIISFLLLWNVALFSQNEQLIIGRTTGVLTINKNKKIRTFGFTKSLAAQVTLPGCTINAKVGDSIHLDFWNISQGNPVSLYCKKIDFVQKDKNGEILIKNESIHHMEHGYYSFLAKKVGTYLYYSPENYPFNLQAGMFGVIIIQPDNNNSQSQILTKEVLWCSHEIDSKWHTDSLMGTEYDSSNNPILIPKYTPNFFCINGQKIENIKGLLDKNNTSKSILLRWVNAGLYDHTIQFPAKVILKIKDDIDSFSITKLKYNKVTLAAGETLELLVNLKDTTTRENIIFQFIEPKSKKVSFKTTIPILYN